jgi:DnaJ-class molecular chaperone
VSKGDTYRKVDQKKYDRNYLRIYGEQCSKCGGTGGGAAAGWTQPCFKCNGVGYVKRK